MPSLASALTFHASFDNGTDADFGRGNRAIYTVGEGGELTNGLGQVAIARGAGRFGDALQFTLERTNIVAYQVEGNVAYSDASFRGTMSFWMKVDPADIPGQYCDPIQVTDKDYADSCIWLDFTKNGAPSDMRLGIFGNRAEWDPKTLNGNAQEFYWRLCKVAEPPFSRDRWTHVAVTWDGINSTAPGRGRLYLNGVYQGATSAIRERFSWDPAKPRIRLGVGKFVGLIDDVAFFDSALSSEQILELRGLDAGVAALRT